MANAFSRYVEPAEDLGNARVRRVDVSRDFRDVADIPDLLTSLARVPVSNARRRVMYLNDVGQPTSLAIGPKTAGCVRVYDLHAAHPDHCDRAAVRVEVQARESWAARYGSITTLGDATPQALTALFLNRWAWSGAGTPVTTLPYFIHAVEQLTDRDGREWSQVRRDGFLGHCLRRVAGCQVHLSGQRRTEYTALIRKLGLPLEVCARDGASSSARRLDLLSGVEEVARVLSGVTE